MLGMTAKTYKGNFMSYLSFIIIIMSLLSFSAHANTQQTSATQTKLDALEKSFNGKIGVYAIDTNNNQNFAYRADARFPIQSTLKFIAVSALLKQSHTDEKLLQKQIHYTKNDLFTWSPITKNHLASGMTLESLGEAAISYSDNTAANIIIKTLGGPQSINNFTHSIGNKTFHIEHYEENLNSDPKKDEDTATPKDMALSLKQLTLDNLLAQPQRNELVAWMRNNTTGYKRMRAGVPIGWVVADKTGSGDYGIANDIGITWPPGCKPLVLAIYTVQNTQEAKRRDDIVASITRILVEHFAMNDSCLKPFT